MKTVVAAVVILGIFSDPTTGEVLYRGRESEELAQKRLVDQLLDNYGPTSMLPTAPVLKVVVRLKPNKLIALDEHAETLILANYAKLRWQDDHLTWSLTNYSNITKIHLFPKDIWTPDLALLNNVDVKFMRYPSDHKYKLQVAYDGHVTWFFPLITSSTCVPQSHCFPFDLQVCNLSFMSWTHDSRYIQIVAASDNDARQLIFESNKVWSMVAFETQNMVKHFGNGANWSLINYQMTFQREPWFYLVTISLPCGLLSLLLLAVFWVPHEAGEKISMATESLVALILFQQLAGTVRPPSGNSLQLLDLYFMTMIILSCTTIASSVLVRSLYFGKGSGLPPPVVRDFIRSRFCGLFLEVPASADEESAAKDRASENGNASSRRDQEELDLAEKKWRADYERRKSCQIDPGSIRRSKREIADRRKSSHLLNMYTIMQRVSQRFSDATQEKTEDRYKKEWKLVAIAIDRIAFVMHLAAAVGITTYVYAKIAFNHNTGSCIMHIL